MLTAAVSSCTNMHAKSSNLGQRLILDLFRFLAFAFARSCAGVGLPARHDVERLGALRPRPEAPGPCNGQSRPTGSRLHSRRQPLLRRHDLLTTRARKALADLGEALSARGLQQSHVALVLELYPQPTAWEEHGRGREGRRRGRAGLGWASIPSPRRSSSERCRTRTTGEDCHTRSSHGAGGHGQIASRSVPAAMPARLKPAALGTGSRGAVPHGREHAGFAGRRQARSGRLSIRCKRRQRLLLVSCSYALCLLMTDCTHTVHVCLRRMSGAASRGSWRQTWEVDFGCGCSCQPCLCSLLQASSAPLFIWGFYHRMRTWALRQLAATRAARAAM